MIRGEVRTTLDVDLLADLRAEHVSPLATALEPEFFIDVESIHEAFAVRRRFNVTRCAGSGGSATAAVLKHTR